MVRWIFKLCFVQNVIKAPPPVKKLNNSHGLLTLCHFLSPVRDIVMDLHSFLHTDGIKSGDGIRDGVLVCIIFNKVNKMSMQMLATIH